MTKLNLIRFAARCGACPVCGSDEHVVLWGDYECYCQVCAVTFEKE